MGRVNRSLLWFIHGMSTVLIAFGYVTTITGLIFGSVRISSVPSINQKTGLKTGGVAPSLPHPAKDSLWQGAQDILGFLK